MGSKAHWENIYTTKDTREVSWFADHVFSSLDPILSLKLPLDARIMDLGGGASTLVDDLLKAGYSHLSVLDLSGAALNVARSRLGEKSRQVTWIEGDVLDYPFESGSFDLWHDRAVFHFLTVPQDRETYRSQVSRALKPGGVLFLNVFAEDGPEKCSGLVIRRHSAEELESFFEADFESISNSLFVHHTPGGTDQRFVQVVLRKKR